MKQQLKRGAEDGRQSNTNLNTGKLIIVTTGFAWENMKLFTLKQQ